MRISVFVIAALPLGAFAFPADVGDIVLAGEKRQASRCTAPAIRVVTGLLSRVSPVASSWCSRFIRQTTAQVTSTTTQSAQASSVFTTVTSTVTSGIAQTTASVTSTITLSVTSTSTVTLTSTVGVLNKRQTPTVVGGDAPIALRGLLSASASAICSCFLGPSPTRTAISTVTSTSTPTLTSTALTTVPSTTSTITQTILTTVTTTAATVTATETQVVTLPLQQNMAIEAYNSNTGALLGYLTPSSPRDANYGTIGATPYRFFIDQASGELRSAYGRVGIDFYSDFHPMALRETTNFYPLFFTLNSDGTFSGWGADRPGYPAIRTLNAWYAPAASDRYTVFVNGNVPPSAPAGVGWTPLFYKAVLFVN